MKRVKDFKNVEDNPRFFLFECLILIISPVFLMSKKCASQFCREITFEINNFWKSKTSSYD